MQLYKPVAIHPEMLDQDDQLTHLATVDAQTDIIMDSAVHSALDHDQKRELVELMELIRTVAATQTHAVAEDKQAIPA